MPKQREAKERKSHGKQEVRDKETHDRETLRELKLLLIETAAWTKTYTHYMAGKLRFSNVLEKVKISSSVPHFLVKLLHCDSEYN